MKKSAHVTATSQRTLEWQALISRLEAQIASGRFPEGCRLPPEAKLSTELGANRYALRRAIAALVAKGVLRSVPHVGSFVAPGRLRIPVSANLSTSAGFARAGLTIASQLVGERKCLPTPAVAKRLGVASRTEVIELIQQSTLNGHPFSQATTWLPADRFERIASLVSASGHVRTALAQMGLQNLRRKSIGIIARPATRHEAIALELPPKSSVLVLETLSVDPAGEPTHVTQCIVDAARIEVVVEF